MNRTNRARLWIPLAVLAAACVLVVLTGILDRQQVWVDMMEDSVRQLRPGRQSREAGDPYGILTEGPGLTLPPGEYRLKWIIDCDGYFVKIDLVSYYIKASDTDYKVNLSYHYYTGEQNQNKKDLVDKDL